METQTRDMIKNQRRFALAVADLDHFKMINDTHGHEAGDRALRLFAQIAQDSLRDDDILARWGGEEFLSCCAAQSLEQLLHTADTGLYAAKDGGRDQVVIGEFDSNDQLPSMRSESNGGPAPRVRRRRGPGR